MNSSADSDANSLRVIVGPTAAGKSVLAMTLSETFGGSIVSADSRQIYRGFDIGTGKPTASERARVPHEGIDVADPEERWSAARFAGAAGTWLQSAVTQGRTPVVVGGSGFWIEALIKPLAPIPALEPVAREQLARTMATWSNDELRERCAVLDPPIARLGPAQWRRAVEVALLTGRPLSEWQRESVTGEMRSVRYLLVDPGRALGDRIAARVHAMFANGWEDEVRSLAARVPPTATAWNACGYERLRAVLADGGRADAARDDVIRETRRYARRQRTWVHHRLVHGPVTRLDPESADAWARAAAWWKGEHRE